MDRIIRHIVLTGGPGGGKTSVLAAITQHFSQEGWYVMTIPEAAASFISGGVCPWRSGPVLFQTIVLEYELFSEDAYRKAATALDFAAVNAERAKEKLPPADKVLIISDRSVLDCRVYIPKESAQVLSAHGVDDAYAAKTYDAVLHLTTLAEFDEEAYLEAQKKDTYRKEPPEEARRLDALTLTAWESHPHQIVVGYHKEMADKKKEVIDKLSELL